MHLHDLSAREWWKAFGVGVVNGLLLSAVVFHLGYVSFWSMAFVAFLRDSLTLRNALLLALALWIGILVVFFPIIGWGFLGLGISPKLIVASFVPHVQFGVFLWGLCLFAFRSA